MLAEKKKIINRKNLAKRGKAPVEVVWITRDDYAPQVTNQREPFDTLSGVSFEMHDGFTAMPRYPIMPLHSLI